MPADSLSAFTPLVDVDPPIAAHVVEALENAGVTAYAEPIVGEVGPYREVRPVDRPTSRVYVLREQREQALAVIATTLPGLRAPFHADAAARAEREELDIAELDTRWAEIVGGYGERAELPADDRPAEDRRSGSGLSRRLVRRAERPQQEPEDVEDDPLDAIDRFVPPEPPPLPRPRTLGARLGWAGVIGGPLLVLVVFAVGLDRGLALVGGAAFVGGLATLIARMPDGERDQDGDGAVV